MPSILAYLGIVFMCCATTGTIALFCSVLLRKTAQSMMATYLSIIVLFCLPLAMRFFAESFFPDASATAIVRSVNSASPFAAAFAVPLKFGNPDFPDVPADWPLYFSYLGFSSILCLVLLGMMVWLFNVRWRVAE
jgi:ABC-type transport system involved in multi-copper enzyme maturation permease subunit